jgi:hypothetical protein
MMSATRRRPSASGEAEKPVASIGWGDGGKRIEHEANPEPSNKD